MSLGLQHIKHVVSGNPTWIFFGRGSSAPTRHTGGGEEGRKQPFSHLLLHPDSSKMVTCGHWGYGGGNRGGGEPVPGVVLIAPGPRVETCWGPALHVVSSDLELLSYATTQLPNHQSHDQAAGNDFTV